MPHPCGGESARRNLSEEIFEAGYQQGLEEGRQLARKRLLRKAKHEIASRMLAAGKFSLEEIAERVELNLAEVRYMATRPVRRAAQNRWRASPSGPDDNLA